MHSTDCRRPPGLGGRLLFGRTRGERDTGRTRPASDRSGNREEPTPVGTARTPGRRGRALEMRLALRRR
jgi:hypothetical protein